MSNFSDHLDDLASVVNSWPDWKKNIFGNYKEQNPMSEQFFKDPNECLKWCIDHPGQRCRDGAGREVWFHEDEENDDELGFQCNILSAKSQSNECYPLFYSDLKHFDLTTLRPVEAEPEKPTLENLAALENWDWMEISYPGGAERFFRVTWGKWKWHYSDLRTALSAGWPVKFGRNEA